MNYSEMFEKVAQPVSGQLEDILKGVTVIAFDVSSTLVHYKDSERFTGYVEDKLYVALLRYLRNHQERLGLDEIAIISARTVEATTAMDSAGLTNMLLTPIENKVDFYKRIRAEGKKILVIDDSLARAFMADAYIDAEDKTVREQLRAEMKSWPTHHISKPDLI